MENKDPGRSKRPGSAHAEKETALLSCLGAKEQLCIQTVLHGWIRSQHRLKMPLSDGCFSVSIINRSDCAVYNLHLRRNVTDIGVIQNR